MSRDETSAPGGLAAHLGIVVDEVTAARVQISMPVTERHLQPYGYLHGGATAALVETAASIGANAAAGEDYVAFGMEVNANHVRPVRGGTLHAEARALHVGRSTHVWEVRVRDEEDRLVCAGRCTLAVVPRG